MKHTLVGKLEDVVLEDGGRAKIGTLYSESGDIFLRVQSWVDEADGEHKSFDEIGELQDFDMSLEEFLELAMKLHAEHGGDSRIRCDAGANNVSVEVYDK